MISGGLTHMQFWYANKCSFASFLATVARSIVNHERIFETAHMWPAIGGAVNCASHIIKYRPCPTTNNSNIMLNGINTDVMLSNFIVLVTNWAVMF